MQINTLKRKTKNKASRQVGRGGTRGKTAGKGTKGQNARSGRKKRPEIRDTIKRLPKLRGRGVNSNKSIKSKYSIINLSMLSGFKEGENVSPKILIEKGIVKTKGGRIPQVKVLGDGKINQKLNFEMCLVSKSARDKIEAVGGSIV
jgi:large subunit ribosomal protein L15